MEKFSYLSRPNLEYLEQQYDNYRKNPDSVDSQWKLFFEGVEFAQNLPAKDSFSSKEFGVYNLIEHYRSYGHLKADLDPLGLQKSNPESFELTKFGLTKDDLNQKFQVGKRLGLDKPTLKDIINELERVYCGTLTAQLAECRPEVRDWFRKELETQPRLDLKNEDRIQVFRELARTESLERFLHTRYVGAKRFSIEGGDALIPVLEHLTRQGTALGVEEIVIGMAHRGRLNVLCNFMEKGVNLIFGEFDGTAYDGHDYDGDVKYHLGYSVDKNTPSGKCHISLAFNPSHLEVVDPVVLGMSRAKQRKRNDMNDRKKVIPLMVHGDAAFAGQGVVSETLQLSQLHGYTAGGSIHIILNNQVGFTTDPKDARSVQYASDIAKSIKAPVLLVNGDDIEACLKAIDLAFRFRQRFGEDVVIDLICYRRYGHNEGDEPAFTQPIMYHQIKNHPTLMNIYAKELETQNVLTQEQADSFYQERIDNLQKILDSVRKDPPKEMAGAFEGLWKGLRRGTLKDFDKTWETKASKANVDKAIRVLTTLPPEEFHVHPKIAKLIAHRKEMAEKNSFDWAMGELIAYGTLCLDGTPVRLSGQDTKRGTFTHRQAVYFDTQTDEEYCPLATLNPQDGEFCIYNSPLSEMAVLGFEFGNSFSDPTYLTIWEAQYGDFANGAQIVIDQFLSSSEEKWMRGSGLTLLLPHGYEGGGPEHSNARPERFLQLCAQANMQVCNLTTPANLFHVFRRQIKRDFRKPLVIMSPKSLLRHPKVVSKYEDFTQGHFEEVLADPKAPDFKKIEKLILCSGKLYYDLDQARDEKYKNTDKTMILRVEQLYPFPQVQLAPFLNGLPKLKTVVWAQEEPKNMGGYTFMAPRLREFLDDLGLKKVDIEYVGRTQRASPATGSPSAHTREQQEIVDMCLKS